MKTGQQLPKLKSVVLLVLLLVCGWLFSGCKDTGATHVAGLLESCKIKLDQRNWEDAIDICSELDDDEGKHLTAIAYMGRSGLTMAEILTELTGSSDSPTTLIFGKIPDTDQKVSDFKKALYLIMGEVQVKDQTLYLEGILLSSLLIFKELKTLLGLSLVDGNIGTCAGTPADINNCSFAPTITEVFNSGYGINVPGNLVFGGLGSAFYQGIAGDITADTSVTSSSRDATTEIVLDLTGDPEYGTINVDVTYDVTVDHATIARGSALYYNKVASAAYAAIGTEDLSSLDFYSKMDTGSNFTIIVSPLPSIKFCNAGAIEPPDATDDKLNDCEILSFLENPGF